MTWLVLFIVFGVAGVIAFFVGVAGVQLSRPDPESGRGSADPSAKAFRRWGFGLAGLMAVVEIVLTIASSVYIIGAGHIGVVYGFGGGKIVSHLDSGTHFVAPWRE